MSAQERRPQGQPKDLVSKKGGTQTKKQLPLKQRLIKALAHPLRVRILAYMNDREWSPNELSEELVEGLSQTSYHVKVLKDFKLIELVRTESKRGATEHFYRALERAYIPTAMAKRIPKSGQQIIANDILEEMNKDIATSILSGKFYERDDCHVSWTPADLDEKGCEEANVLADEFVERFLQIQGNSSNRRAESENGGEHIPTSAALLVFGSEHRKTMRKRSRKHTKKKKSK